MANCGNAENPLSNEVFKIFRGTWPVTRLGQLGEALWGRGMKGANTLAGRLLRPCRKGGSNLKGVGGQSLERELRFPDYFGAPSIGGGGSNDGRVDRGGQTLRRLGVFLGTFYNRHFIFYL